MQINSSNWVNFKIGEYFSGENTGNILARDIIDGSGNTPFVTASGINNGVAAKIDASKYEIIKGHCILIGGKTFTITYQHQDFVSNDSHNIVIRAKNNTISENTYLFLVTALKASLSSKYSWGDAVTKDKLLDNYIKLPATSEGQPDYSFMDSYMKGINASVMSSVAAFNALIGGGISQGKINVSEWQNFKIGDLFPDIVKPEVYHSREVVQFDDGIPYIVRSKYNNGMKYRVRKTDSMKVSPSGVISFGAENASFFYQSEEWCSGRDIYYINTTQHSESVCKFLTVCFNKVTSKYNYSFGLFPDLLKEETIKLPVDKKGKPDWEYMGHFIDTIEATTSIFTSKLYSIT